MDNLVDRFKDHWIGGIITVGMICGVGGWTLAQELYVKPRDFTIVDLEKQLKNAQESGNRAKKDDSEENISKEKPSHLDLNKLDLNEIDEWLLPYHSWLEKEGKNEKDTRLIKGFLVEVMESDEVEGAAEFSYELEPSPNFAITGYAFRVINIENSKLIEPLKRKKNNRSIGFVVPECNKGDKILAVLRISWTTDVKVTNSQGLFRSIIN